MTVENLTSEIQKGTRGEHRRSHAGATGRWPRLVDQTSASGHRAQSDILSLTAQFLRDDYKYMFGWLWDLSLDLLNTWDIL
jgi:hypothetical protein